MPYKEYQPDPKLSHCIDCFWSYTSSGKPKGSANIIIPDNRSDILVDFTLRKKPVSSFIGPMTRPVKSLKSDLIGIRFNPGYSYALFGIPMSEFTDISVCLKEFWRDAERLEEEVSKGQNIIQRIRALQDMFLNCKNISIPIEGRFIYAQRKMDENSEYFSIEALSLELDMSRQHLRRLFQKYIGINPVQYMRICRIKKVIEHIRLQNEHISFSRLAQDFGYYDQSHMIADFKEFTLSPPSEYFRKKQ